MNQLPQHRWTRWLALGWATSILFLGAVPALKAKGETEKSPPPKLTIDNKPLVRDGNLPRSFAPVVRKVSDSVVQVFTSARVQAPQMQGFGLPFEYFFGDPRQMDPNRRRGGQPRQQGIGSGVIVTRDGYILTNNHVVEGAEDVKVKLADGRELAAKIVGRDEGTDVAVLRVEADDLSPATLSDSDRIEVGDVVFAVGNPFAIGQTVTMGIISARGRATPLGLPYEDFIQTDAAINPGNSGGALVDAEGRLIGINTAILSRSGGNQGIGFAVPVNMARDVMESLVTEGRVSRGYLGVLPQDITPAIARKMNLKESTGALIAEVTPKGPAEKAGLESGDVVLEFNGKPVRDARHLRLEVARTKPGSTVPMKIQREGSSKTLKVTVKERNEEALAKLDNGGRPGGDEGTLNGVAVADLNRQTRQQWGIPERIKGVLVTEVDESSASWDAGLRPGDVILEINREPVTAADQAVGLTENPKDKTTLLKLWRANQTRFLVVDESGSGK